MRSIKSLIVLLFMVLLVASVQAADKPIELSITTSGGATNRSVTEFPNAVTRDISSSLKLQAMEYSVGGIITATNTLSIKRGTNGVAYKTVGVASNTAGSITGVSFESNNWWFVPGDSIVVQSDATNVTAVKLILLEN